MLAIGHVISLQSNILIHVWDSMPNHFVLHLCIGIIQVRHWNLFTAIYVAILPKSMIFLNGPGILEHK
jgi:ABC-type microcin C transport system permease subunit YejE